MKGFTRNLSTALAIITLLIALLIIGSWGFPATVTDIGRPVKFNTGLCLLLSAITLYLLNREENSRIGQMISGILPLIVLLLALLTLAQYIFRVDLGIDQLLIREKNPSPTTLYPGRMAALTSCIFILLSIAFLLLRKKKFLLLVQIILIIGLVILSLIFLVYITRTHNDQFSLFIPASLHTSFSLLILYIGAFFCLPLHYLRFSFQKRVAAFFLFTLLLLLIVFLGFRQNARRFNDTARWVEHTNTAILQSLRVKSLAQDIETSARGFIISGREDSLEGYKKAIPAIYQAVRDLKASTRDNPLQQARIDSLNELVHRNIELRQQLVEIRKTGGFEAAQRFFETGISKQKMEELLVMISAIEQEETLLLVKRRTDNAASIDGSNRVIVLFQVLTGLLLLGAFFIIYKNTRFRNRAEKEIRDLNENLEQKVVEKTSELLKNELHFRNILDNLLEGAQIIGFDWKYKYVNDTFLQHSKYRREELLGYSVMEKYPGIEQASIFPVYEKCFNERVAIHLENEFIFPDGTMGWFELSFQPVPEGIFILSVDITPRKRSEILLKELNETLEKRAVELQSSNTELERFAYVASHDLQEPLRMVSSFLHLLEKKMEGKLDDSAKQYIGFAVDGAERMKNLIQDLLRYSRVGTSKESITDVDCNEILESVRSVLSLTIRETGATLLVKNLPVIKAIPAQILQLFQNLVGNAIKYHGEAPSLIEVDCTEKEKSWEFSVKDNGIGIDPRFFDKIFIIFQRLHNKTDYAGTGIGLSICKKIVERHGGNIWVESSPGNGSRFYFTIPKTSV
ncbi:MAG: CHASE3 domain-containing protein [Chitinophagaceae bacterium]